MHHLATRLAARTQQGDKMLLSEQDPGGTIPAGVTIVSLDLIPDITTFSARKMSLAVLVPVFIILRVLQIRFLDTNQVFGIPPVLKNSFPVPTPATPIRPTVRTFSLATMRGTPTRRVLQL